MSRNPSEITQEELDDYIKSGGKIVSLDDMLASPFLKMRRLVNDSCTDFGKSFSGNKAAGVRLRKAMMEVRELAKQVKAESLEV